MGRKTYNSFYINDNSTQFNSTQLCSPLELQKIMRSRIFLQNLWTILMNWKSPHWTIPWIKPTTRLRVEAKIRSCLRCSVIHSMKISTNMVSRWYQCFKWTRQINKPIDTILWTGKLVQVDICIHTHRHTHTSYIQYSLIGDHTWAV